MDRIVSILNPSSNPFLRFHIQFIGIRRIRISDFELTPGYGIGYGMQNCVKYGLSEN
jgi:hypothetical protein